MYDLVHRRFQKIIGISVVLVAVALVGCASAPPPDPLPERDSSEMEPAEPHVEEERDQAHGRRTPDRESDSDDPVVESTDSTDSGGSAGPADLAESATAAERYGGASEESEAAESTELTEDAAITNLLRDMSLRQRIGQMIMPGLIYDRSGSPVRTMNEELLTLIQEIEPGGIVLFGPNIATVEQVRNLTRAMHTVSNVPLTIAVDQEGGFVRRVVPQEGMPATAIPSARAVGRLGDPVVAYELGRAIGRELRSLGIAMNFAPVADVQTNPDNPVIGSRSYGSDPQLVGEMVAATVRGLQAEGVSAVVKHFPGHGDTVQDSHDEAATVSHDLARLQRIELVPFDRGIEAGADGVMVGHIAVPEVSGSSLPATLDAVLVEGILRERLGFEGLVVTDSLVMDGLTRYFDADTIAVRAIQAGVDVLLLPAHPGAAVTAIETAVTAGEISPQRIDRSVRRILQVKLSRGLLVVSQETGRVIPGEHLTPQEVIMGTEEHRGLVEIIRQGEQP